MCFSQIPFSYTKPLFSIALKQIKKKIEQNRHSYKAIYNNKNSEPVTLNITQTFIINKQILLLPFLLLSYITKIDELKTILVIIMTYFQF